MALEEQAVREFFWLIHVRIPFASANCVAHTHILPTARGLTGPDENTLRLDVYRPTTEWKVVAYDREDALVMLAWLSLIHWRNVVETNQEYEVPDTSERDGVCVSNDLRDAYGA